MMPPRVRRRLKLHPRRNSGGLVQSYFQAGPQLGPSFIFPILGQKTCLIDAVSSHCLLRVDNFHEGKPGEAPRARSARLTRSIDYMYCEDYCGLGLTDESQHSYS